MIGKTILHYEITEKLGEGGMGVVYKAEDTKLKRTVALKFLPPNALANEEDKARFIHEAQAAAALHHPNICTVYEINEAEGQTFISMAYLPGKSLRERIQEGPRPLAEILDVAVHAARGLKAAHEKGIIHRDIKPSNIMFSESDQVTVMDFGLAKSKRQTLVTKVRTTVGTVAYMSPEQTRGDEVDFRTDIWSLGVILYEMTTGQRPFRGDYDEAVIYSILNEPPRPVHELREDADPNLVHIIEKATSKDPGERYRKIDEMLADLELLRDELRSGTSQAWSSTRSRFAAVERPSLARRILSPGVLVPFLAVIALAVVAAMFLRREGGVVTETVAVTDEQGQTIERAIPRSEYRKSFALYSFDNKTGDLANDWVNVAIPYLIEIDLMQDQIVTVRSCIDGFAIGRLQQAGFTRWEQAPWSLKRRIAKDSHLDYLVTGSYAIENGEYVVKRSLHDASTGRLVTEKTYRGRDVFALADDISVDLKHDLGIPDDYIESLDDLALAEMTTRRPQAMQPFCNGLDDRVFGQDWQRAIGHMERAVEQDSTFAFAYFQLVILYLNTNQNEKCERALQSVMRYLYKMPEPYQFYMKYVYYLLKKSPEKTIAVLRMMTDFYPEDIDARQTLALVYTNHLRFDEAIEQYEKTLDIDPGRSEILQTIGGLYRRKGDFDKALEYFEDYAERHPDIANSFTVIAAIYRDRGEYDEATRYYDKALLIEPENISALRWLADIDARLGKADRAVTKYNEALGLSKAPADRYRLYEALQEFYSNRGEMTRSIEFMRLKWEQLAQVGSPVGTLMDELMDARYYARAGQTDKAFETVESTSRQMEGPYETLSHFGYVFLYIEMEEPDSAEVALDRFKPFLDAYKLEELPRIVHFVEGRIAELREDFKGAIESFEIQAELSPWDVMPYCYIGRCYRELGELEKAKEALEKVLKVFPVNPDCLYELALVYAESGEMERATRTLEKALAVWQNADPVYEPARKAREKLAEWTS